MNKEFVPYEEALALKELGFNEPCLGHYDNPENSVWITDSPPYYANKENVCLSPLYQQAFRWFREKHNLYQYIEPSFDCIKLGYQNYSWLIKLRERVFIKNGTFKTYEEAELACLKKLIEIIKNK
jgi:hypothetical protein